MAIQDYNPQKTLMGKIEPESFDYNNEQLRNIINQMRDRIEALEKRITALENK